MEKKQSRYKEMERFMTWVLLADLFLFVVYLIAAGNGIIWLKVIVAIIAILASALCLGFLYLSQELMRPRSLWMTTTAGAIAVCIIFSLLLGFPSPNPYKQTSEPISTVQTGDTTPT